MKLRCDLLDFLIDTQRGVYRIITLAKVFHMHKTVMAIDAMDLMIQNLNHNTTSELKLKQVLTYFGKHGVRAKDPKDPIQTIYMSPKNAKLIGDLMQPVIDELKAQRTHP